MLTHNVIWKILLHMRDLGKKISIVLELLCHIHDTRGYLYL